MERITQKDLERVVKSLNIVTGSPTESYRMETGKYVSNINNYHLDMAYGGVKLVRMDNESGGIREVLHTGFTTKRDLYRQMQSFVLGIQEVAK